MECLSCCTFLPCQLVQKQPASILGSQLKTFFHLFGDGFLQFHPFTQKMIVSLGNGHTAGSVAAGKNTMCVHSNMAVLLRVSRWSKFFRLKPHFILHRRRGAAQKKKRNKVESKGKLKSKAWGEKVWPRAAPTLGWSCKEVKQYKKNCEGLVLINDLRSLVPPMLRFSRKKNKKW